MSIESKVCSLELSQALELLLCGLLVLLLFLPEISMLLLKLIEEKLVEV